MGIGQVRLGGEAVVTNVDPDPLHLHILDVQGVKEVCVLGEGGCLGLLEKLSVTGTTLKEGT
jgi:hypothetical protein